MQFKNIQVYPPDRSASIEETGSGAEPDPVSTEDQAMVMLSRVIEMSDQAAMTDDNTCTRCELGVVHKKRWTNHEQKGNKR